VTKKGKEKDLLLAPKKTGERQRNGVVGPTVQKKKERGKKKKGTAESRQPRCHVPTRTKSRVVLHLRQAPPRRRTQEKKKKRNKGRKPPDDGLSKKSDQLPSAMHMRESLPLSEDVDKKKNQRTHPHPASTSHAMTGGIPAIKIISQGKGRKKNRPTLTRTRNENDEMHLGYSIFQAQECPAAAKQKEPRKGNPANHDTCRARHKKGVPRVFLSGTTIVHFTRGGKNPADQEHHGR